MRKETSCTIPQAKLALEQEGNNYAAALTFLQSHQAVDTRKLEAKQGFVAAAVSPTSRRHGILCALHCETDFVAKSDLFQECMSATIRSALYYQLPFDVGEDTAAATVSVTSRDSATSGNSYSSKSLDMMMQMPLVPAPEISAVSGMHEMESLEAKMQACMSKLGEKVCLGRVSTLEVDDPSVSLLGAYVHSGGGALAPGLGRIGALIKLNVEWTPGADVVSQRQVFAELGKFADRLAQHVVGFHPLYLDDAEAAQAVSTTAMDESAVEAEGRVLLDQEFLFGGGRVHEVLASLSTRFPGVVQSVRVSSFLRHSIE